MEWGSAADWAQVVFSALTFFVAVGAFANVSRWTRQRERYRFTVEAKRVQKNLMSLHVRYEGHTRSAGTLLEMHSEQARFVTAYLREDGKADADRINSEARHHGTMVVPHVHGTDPPVFSGTGFVVWPEQQHAVEITFSVQHPPHHERLRRTMLISPIV